MSLVADQNNFVYQAVPAVIEEPAVLLTPVPFKEQVSDKILWVYIIVAVIILIILFWIAGSASTYFNSLNKPTWTNAPAIWGTLMVIVVLILAYANFKAFRVANAAYRNNIIVTVIIQAILLIAWFWVFYKTENPMNAFYIALVLLLVTLWQLFVLYRVDPAAGWMALPFLVWLLLAIYVNWSISDTNRPM